VRQLLFENLQIVRLEIFFGSVVIKGVTGPFLEYVHGYSRENNRGNFIVAFLTYVWEALELFKEIWQEMADGSINTSDHQNCSILLFMMLLPGCLLLFSPGFYSLF